MWYLEVLLTTIGKFEWEDTAFVKMQLVFVRLGVMEHLHVAALHPNSQPFSSGTVAQWEDLEQGHNSEVKGRLLRDLKLCKMSQC